MKAPCILRCRFPPSPSHTGQAPLSASGVPIWLNYFIFAASTLSDVLTAYCDPWLFRSAQISKPLPPVSVSLGFPGRALLRRVLRVCCPSCGIGDLSAYPFRGATGGSGVARIAIYTHSGHALPYPYDLRTGPGSLSLGINGSSGPSSPTVYWGIMVRGTLRTIPRIPFLPPP